MKRKSKIFLSLTIVLVSYFLYSYHSENKKYEILNEIFTDMDYNFENICINKTYIHYSPKQFESFSLIDKPSVYTQYFLQYYLGTFSDFKNWNARKIKPNRIRYKDDESNEQYSNILVDCSVELIKKKKNGKIIWTTSNPTSMSISPPILSANGKTAIIELSSNCGMLCGSSNSYLFKKINGKWKLIEENLSWIS